MQTNTAGIELIKNFEKFSPTVYLDQAGRETIGYGHLIKPGEKFTMISTEEAEVLLKQDLLEAEQGVNHVVQIPLNSNQFSALVSLTFNIGVAAFAHSSVLKYVNLQDWTKAGAAFLLWNKVTINGKLTVSAGLKKRRIAEVFLFKRPLFEQPKPILTSRTIVGSGVAGLSSVSLIADQVNNIVDQTQPIQTQLMFAGIDVRYLTIGLAILALVGIGLTIYARLSDRNSGKV